jgi:hypothetical protein
MISRFIAPEDNKWGEYLSRNPHDFYHLPKYVEICGKYEGGKPTAFYVESTKPSFLAPLLIREIPYGLGAPKGWYDCVSSYGYSTPLTSASGHLLENFFESFSHAARELGIVTALFRLHPFLSLDHSALGKFGLVMDHGETVYVDLSKREEEIWTETSTNHKRNIRRLINSGFSVSLDDWSRLKDFTAIYQLTMRRVGAGTAYMFSQEYFQDLKTALGDQLHLCCVVSPANKVASAGLFVETQGIVQYHLGGTAKEYLPLAPSKLLLYFVGDWARNRSNKVFHLGGGVGGAHDSLHQFKSGFSKNRGRFCTFRMILDEKKYRILNQLAQIRYPGQNDRRAQFFPQYRQ